MGSTKPVGHRTISVGVAILTISSSFLVGDTLALSVSTPAHLKKIKLLADDTVVDESNPNFVTSTFYYSANVERFFAEMNLNFMFSTALDKIAFLPFGLMLDMYRYKIFSGEITPEQYNEKWWQHV